MPNIRQMFHLLAARQISVNKVPLDFFVDKIDNGEYYSFSRFGDGEWSAVLGRSGSNCDGHNYTKGLQNALTEALISPKEYYYGIQWFALKNLGIPITSFCRKHKLLQTWYEANIFHDANAAGELNNFVKALRKKSIVVIGPTHLKELTLFPVSHFIEIPSQNCFDSYDLIKKEILEAPVASKDVVYLFSASMAANALIHDLYDELGKSNWLLDVGALWDVYTGVKSRQVYNEDWEERIMKNSAE